MGMTPQTHVTRHRHAFPPAHAEVIVIPTQQHSDNLTPYTKATRHIPCPTTYTRHIQTVAFSPGCTCMPAFPSVIRSTEEDSDARSASTPMLSSSSRQESFFPSCSHRPWWEETWNFIRQESFSLMAGLILRLDNFSMIYTCCVQYYIDNDACDQTISDTVRRRHYRNGNEG